MNTILLLGTAGLVIGGLRALILKREIGTGTLVGVSVGTLTGLFTALFIGHYLVPVADVVYGPAPLVAMRSSDGTSGTFVWGSGSVGSTVNYNFLQKMDDGSLAPRSVPADYLVRLIEDPELSNIGYWRTTIREADKMSLLYNWSLNANEGRRTVIRQEFRVPVGTIVQGFSIK